MSDTFEVHLERLEGYRFEVDYALPGVAKQIVDESPPLGTGTGANPARLLATAVGDCLSASLIFCLGKSRVEVASLRTTVTGVLQRNERNRLRVGRLDVAITVDVRGAEPVRTAKCLEVFEDYCVVTASVRKGIPVGVTVDDEQGRRLFTSSAE